MISIVIFVVKFRNSLLLRIGLVIKEFEYVTTTIPIPIQDWIGYGNMLFGVGSICENALIACGREGKIMELKGIDEIREGRKEQRTESLND